MSWYVIINNEYSGQPATRYITGFAGSTSVTIFQVDEENLKNCKIIPENSSQNHSHILQNMRMIGAGHLMIDSRYFGEEKRIKSENRKIARFEVIQIGREYTAKQAVDGIIKKEKIEKIIIDGAITAYSSYVKLQEHRIEVKSENNIFEKMRSIKTVAEQKLVKQAIMIAEKAFASVKSFIVAGVTEREIAARIEYEMKIQGGDKESFDTIVASGARAALPHAETSTKIIESTDSVIIDFGCFYKGYASDLTQTILMPDASEELHKIFGVVQKAHDMAVSAIKPGIPAKDIDYVARKMIVDAGYGDKFVHSTGHGVGMSVHESPHIGANSEDILEKGNIITIEPGIYLPGVGGVRIETTEVVE